MGIIYFFIGLFGFNAFIFALTGRGGGVDFTKKEQTNVWHNKAKTLEVNEYKNRREVTNYTAYSKPAEVPLRFND